MFQNIEKLTIVQAIPRNIESTATKLIDGISYTENLKLAC
jgi:hypothetical protein